ncbi:MAG TPA: type II secretion system minor pseudopilin GspI [Sphingobium sp.]
MPTFIPASNSAPAGPAKDAPVQGEGKSATTSGTACTQQASAALRFSSAHGFTRPRRSAENGFTPLRRSAENGFTLLEMLVALAIFSLAGLALVRLQAVSVRTAADLDTRLIAQITARNLAYERLTDPTSPALGESEGAIANAGRELHWRQVVTPAADRRLAQVTVSVTGGAGQSPAVVSVVRPAP